MVHPNNPAAKFARSPIDVFAPLAAYRQFILWVLVQQGDGKKPDKMPVNPNTLKVSNAHDPNIWLDLNTAYQKAIDHNLGLGFVFTENDPLFFVDIDGCLLDNGQWSQVATDVCARFPGAFMEVSQSGRGLHIIGIGQAPADRKKKASEYGLELYTSGRFVALTGTGAQGKIYYDYTQNLTAFAEQYFQKQNAKLDFEWTTEPVPEWSGPEDDQVLINKMLQTRSGASEFGDRASVADEWYCNIESLAVAFPSKTGTYAFDHSSADAALMQHLAFWTGKNCERMDRLFRQSGLYRDKWEEREDYRIETIKHACGLCENVYGSRNQNVDGTPPGIVETERTRDNTIEVRDGGYQFLDATQQQQYFAGCVYVRDLHKVFVPDGSLLKPEQFNATYGGYVFALDAINDKITKRAFEVLTESQAVRFPKAHSLCFRPELAPGTIVTESRLTLINSYVPAYGERRPGDPKPFLTHTAKLLPNDNDREIFLSYLAALVQYPGVKFQWAPVLQGVEGNGKTVFFRVAAYALGERYTHTPNAADIDNTFNSWIEGRLLICVEEIHTAGRQELADAIKPLITNPRIEIHAKNQNQRTGDNRANFLIFSNHRDAVLKTETDRRYCVFYTAQQNFDDLERDGLGGQYFRNLYGWLESEGYAVVADYLARRPVTVDVLGRAPATSSTVQAMRESLGVAEQILMEAVDLERLGFRGDIICTTAAGELLRSHGKKLSPQKISQALLNIGFIRHPALTASAGKVKITGMVRRLYVRRGSLAAQITTPEGVRDYFQKMEMAGVPSVPSSSKCLEPR